MISVITPVYNSSQYLRQCIDSVLAQTHTDWEMILIDDGSTDDSLKIIREYESRDSRIRVFVQENSGPSVARNVGLREMKGDYVTFLDADDWFAPDTLRTVWECIEQSHPDMVLWHYRRFRDGSYHSTKTLIPPKGFYGKADTEKFAQEFIFHLNGSLYVNTLWVRCIRADIIRENQLAFEPALRRAEDYVFLAKAQFRLNSFYSLPDQELTVHRDNDRSITHSYIKNYSDMVEQMVNSLTADPCIRAVDDLEERIACIYISRLRTTLQMEIQNANHSLREAWMHSRDAMERENVRQSVSRLGMAQGKRLFGRFFPFLKLGFKRITFFLLLTAEKRRKTHKSE